MLETKLAARTPSVERSAIRGVRPPSATLVEALEKAAAEHAPYLVFHGAGGPERFTAAAALVAARRWAASLAASGVRPGDRVPLLLPTGPDFVGAFLGALCLGAVPTPLASPLTFGSLDRYLENLARVVEDARATALCTTERFEGPIAEVDAMRRQLRAVLTPARVAAGARPASPLPSIDRSIDPGAPGLLQYTSGSTGRPKGVLVSHRALVSNAYAIADALALTHRDVGVSWLPLFHDMGLIGSIVLPLCHPFEVHVLAPEAFIMRPRRWLQVLTDVGGTISPAPNFAYDLCTSRIRDLEGLDLQRWRVALNGAEAVHASTLDRFAARFAEVGFDRRAMRPAYGLAESTLAVSFGGGSAEPRILAVDGDALEAGEVRGPGARRLVSVGRPVAGARVRVTDEAGRMLPERAVGEIRTAGPSLMDGYFENEEATAAALDGGWLRTGDLGAIVDGELYVVGRAKDVIVLGGRNIHPDEIERVAREVEGVRGGAAAFAVVDPARGTESLVVAVEVRAVDEASRKRIAKAVRGELLAVLGIGPDRVETYRLDALPRTTSGKIRRGACAALGSAR